MQRRDFLGTILAGLSATALPMELLATPAPDPVVWNAATLTAELEKMFTCRVGPATAFYETLASTGEILDKPRAALPAGTPINRYTYVTYVCGIEGGPADEAEARLAKHFYDVFSEVPVEQLVWRRQPHFESQEIVEYGDTFLTHEQIEDEVWKSTEVNGRRKFNEHAQLVLPPGVELEFESNSYKYVTKRTTLHKMRMRLVMPELQEAALPTYIKPEGTVNTPRIL